MSYDIGTHFTFSPEPAATRQSMEWSIGTEITFATILDDVRIFLPRLFRRDTLTV